MKGLIPMEYKYKKAGRPTKQDFVNLKKVQALMESKTLKEAYQKIHPDASGETARAGAGTMLTAEVFEEIKRLMGIEAVVQANKDTLEKVLFLVVSRWIAKEEKTADMIAAVRELTKLVPEFKDKLQIEDISNASEEELDRKLRGFGYDPSIVASTN